MQRKPRCCPYAQTPRFQIFNSVHRLQEVKLNIFLYGKILPICNVCPIYRCYIGCNKYDTYIYTA